MEGAQEVLIQKIGLCIIKVLPCPHANKQVLEMAFKEGRVRTQIPQLRVILFC